MEKPAETAQETKEEPIVQTPPAAEAPENAEAAPAKKKRRRRGSGKSKKQAENIAVAENTVKSDEVPAVQETPQTTETAEPAKKKSRRRRSKKKNGAAAENNTAVTAEAVIAEPAPEKENAPETKQEPSEKKHSRRRSRGGKKKVDTNTAAENANENAEKVSRSMIGKEVVLEQVKVRKGQHGIQGYYQGVLVTVAPNQMPNAPESYPGTDFKVRILKVNPQGTQYIGRIPK